MAEDSVKIYSSGIVVSEGSSSYAAVLEAGGNDLIVATSGGIVAETSMGAGAVLSAGPGAIISGININDEGAVLSGVDVYCSGAEKWYGPAACATFGSIVLSGGTFTNNVASASGGYLGQGGALEAYEGSISISGGIYTSNTATGGGGAILGIGGTTEITGASFTGNQAAYGGAVEISQVGGSAVVSGATFTSNTAEYGGAVEVHQGASALIAGGEFTGNEAVSGGAVMVDAYAAEKSYLTISDAVFTGNTAEQGGAILNDGVLVVSGAEFAENEAEDGKGGALYNNGTATVTGAAFAENTAVYGGAIWQGKKKLALTDVVLDGNKAIYGGAMYLTGSGATVVSGGEFIGNGALYDDDYELGGMGGALYVTAAATVTVADATFTGNVAEVNPDNEWDGGCGGAVINYGSLTVTGGEFAGNSAYYGAGLYNQAGAGTPMTVTDVNFTNNAATYGGAGICNCWGELVVSGGEISGNSVTIRDGAGIANWSEAEITGTVFTENLAVKGGALSHTGTTLTVTDAIFGGNEAEEGGAFWNMNEWGDSEATLVNCSFTENTAEAGGAIWNGETLTVEGGEFSANSAVDGKGGALYNSGAAVTSMANFIENTAVHGGAIYQNGDIEIKDAYIADNTAIYGGAIYANGSGSTIISAASFEGNSASYDEDYDLGGMGGAIYVTAGATVTVEDAFFEGNVAEVNPDNEWDGGCGGAVINYGNFTVSGGMFMANSAYYGAGLYNQAGAGKPMTVTDVEFMNNSATYGGAGICNCWGELVVSGGAFTGNTVEISDGGAIANWSVATVTGATFTGNTAVKGGAISNSWAESITISDCTFNGNTATQGGAIWNNAAMTIENCTFETPTDTVWNEGTVTVNGTGNIFSSIWTSGTITVNGAGTFQSLQLSLANSTTESAAVVNGLSNLSGGAVSIIVPVEMADGTYKVAAGLDNWSGDIAFTVGAEDTGYFFAVENNAVTEAYSQIVSHDHIYTLAVEEGTMKLQVGGEIATLSPTGSIVTGGTSVNNGKDRAAKWVGGSVTSGATVYLVGDGETTRNAWLGIEGTNTSEATIYGAASGGAVETVDLWVTSGAVLGRLAAGAEAFGGVESVKLTIDDATATGRIYAGGFGDVTSTTETLIAGGTFEKDFYAGALANYNKTETLTDVGDVTLTVTGGTFAGNIYGASAVKVGDKELEEVAHTAANVNITLAGGNATKGSFCLFGGGYATGTSGADAYTVESVTISVSGGDWGTANGGRGIFGGIFASNVSAGVWEDTAGETDVAITVTGGTMGNVYGGGWAQKDGTSTVEGAVNITVTGGSIANIYGGGSHSTNPSYMNNRTSVGSVNITVAGGDITDAVYARGQLDGDTVVGNAFVTFTGAQDFGCAAYGYTYSTGADNLAHLNFNGYTGTFSGAIGGFADITLDGATAMTLTTAAGNVTNSEWTFDLAGTEEEAPLLTWNNADFAGDNVKVNFADSTQAKAGWRIAEANFTGATFDLTVGGTEIAGDLALGDKIAAGDYKNWGFTLENSALKFKKLA